MWTVMSILKGAKLLNTDKSEMKEWLQMKKKKSV